MSASDGLSIGERIRNEREKRSWSQSTLAEKIGCSVEAINKWENNKSVPQSKLRVKLAEVFGKSLVELGFVKEDVSERQELAIPDDEERYKTLWGIDLIGREEDIKAIYDRLAKMQQDKVPILALVGVPGVGKSELARQFKERARTREYFPQVCEVVEISTYESIETVRRRIDEALTGTDTSKPTLVILDNCELIENIARARVELHKYLKMHPHVTILATSTVSMTMREHEFEVKTLKAPQSEKEPLETLKGYTAIQLFEESAQPGFTLTEDNAAKVAEICMALDGLPLGIVIAGREAGLRSIDRFYEKLRTLQDIQDPLLKGERLGHISVNALLKISYELLEKEEHGKQLQTLFRRLGTFVDNCMIEAATAVCSLDDLPEYETDDGKEAFENLLRTLESHSLVIFTKRWVDIAHTTIRIFARSLLQGTEFEETRKRYLNYYHSLLERGDNWWMSGRKAEWNRVEIIEQANLHDAVREMRQIRDKVMLQELRNIFQEELDALLDLFDAETLQIYYDETKLFWKNFARVFQIYYDEDKDKPFFWQGYFVRPPKFSDEEKKKLRIFKDACIDISQHSPYPLSEEGSDHWKNSDFASITVGSISS